MKELYSGPFKLIYENGFIRYISYNGDEILRMIYFALRDENWSTYPVKIYNERVDVSEQSFTIRYEAENRREEELLIRWIAVIEGTSSGVITFSLEGEVIHNHKKNRAGFCVLHPLRETINQPVVIAHADGTVTENTFPEYIAPQDPFVDIIEMKWRIRKNWYTLRFEGDIFETEDQRNWSDASFKTFCTPLREPFPVLLKKGDRIAQRITFRPENSIASAAEAPTTEITVSDDVAEIPFIGIGSSPSEEFTEEIFSAIKTLSLDHYRIDVDLTSIEWQDSFTNDVLISERLELPLEIVIQLPTDPRDGVDAFINLIDKEKVPVRKITLLSKGEQTTRQHHVDLIPFLKSIFPKASVGAGTDFNFTELNRERFDAAASDYVTFALDPQEHATDDLTVIENLEAQYYGVLSARAIYERDVHVSPVLLKRKYNPYATDPAAFIVPEAERTEPRQLTPFCAVWTLGSIKQLTDAGATSVTYFHTVGPHGIISEAGEPYPVFHALRSIGDTGTRKVLRTTSSSPLKVDGMIFENGTAVIWNYTDAVQQVILPSGLFSIEGKEIRIIEDGV